MHEENGNDCKKTGIRLDVGEALVGCGCVIAIFLLLGGGEAVATIIRAWRGY